MNKFIRRNNKKLLAIASAFLMITFIANRGFGPNSGGRDAVVIGNIGNDKITEGEMDNSRQQWRLLKQALVFEYPEHSGQYLPFLMYHFAPAQAIDQDPKLYLLLQEEAQRLGADVSQQEVQDFLTNPQIDIQMPNGSVARFDQMEGVDPDYAIDIKDAAAGFLRVHQASSRAMDVCKFSRPVRDFALAEDHQNISVRLVEFDAKKFDSKVPEPTTQELQQQLKDFSNVEASGTGSEKNPLGFGYEIPNQVRLQTISVSRQQLKDAVSRTKSDYDWDVLARGYYLKHKSDFATTQTATATQPAATTKPYEEARAEVMDRVLAPEVDDLSDRLQKSILATLSQDWNSYHAAHPETQPSTSPAVSETSSLGVAYNSYDYLKALAAKVQKDFNVLPETAAYNKPLSTEDLSNLAGIGRAHTAGGALSLQLVASDPSLALYQPSAPLQDDRSTFYVCRVTERIPAHAPASIADVSDTVKSDWHKAQEYKMALQEATSLHDAAVKSGLTAAAAASGELVVTTPPFSASLSKATDPVPTVPLTGEDVAMFKQKCQSILESAAKHEPPVAVVEAPNEFKVLVIELSDVQPDWANGQRYVAEASVTRELMSEFARPLEQEWYSLSAVEARLGYVDVQKNKS